MILSRLKVHNVRSYTSATLGLAPGTTLLTGDVGSGKTSLLYAIEMALFGFSEVEPAYLVRHRAREAEVALDLADGSTTYEFRRRFRRRFQRGKESFEIEESSFAVDGQRTKYSATELRQRSIDLLGFPDNPNPRAHSDVWRWAVYIPQERMRDVLLQSPSERIETARKALGIEQYRTAADNAAELASELRRIAELHEAQAEGFKHWTDELPRWSAIRLTRGRELEEQSAEERRRREEQAEAQLRLADAEAARAERDRDRKESERLQRRATERTAERAEGERRIADRERAAATLREDRERVLREAAGWAGKADQVEPAREELRGLESSLRQFDQLVRTQARAHAAVDAARRALSDLERRRLELVAERARTATSLAEAESERPLKEPPAPTPRELSTISEELETARRSVEQSAGELAAAHHVTSELEELLTLGTCPRCGQAVTAADHRSHLEEARTGERTSEARVEEGRRAVSDLEAERAARERYERARERFLLVEQRRQDIRSALERVEATAAALVARVEEEGLRLSTAEAELSALGPKLAERDRSEERRAALQAELRGAEAARNEATRCEEAARGLAARAALVGEELERARSELARLIERSATEAEEHRRLLDRLTAASDVDRRSTEARNREQEARGELERIIARLERTRADLDEADRRIADADRGVRARNERLAESAHARGLAGWIAREFREGLLELEKRRLAQAQAEFNRAFARYFQILIEDPNLVARCDLAFSPAVEIDGETTPPEALSGGERTALALAFRLAMGRVVREAGRLRIETLILDEPTDGFSPEQVGRMSELLGELEVRQILVVSHEAGLSGIADHVVEVVKDGGRSVLRAGGSTAAEEPEPEAPEEAPAPRSRRRAKSGATLADAATSASDGTLPDPTASGPPREGSRSGAPAASDRPAS